MHSVQYLMMKAETCSLGNVYFSKACVKRQLETDKTNVLITNGSLMEVESMLNTPQYFWPSFGYHLSWKPFLSIWKWPFYTSFTVYTFIKNLAFTPYPQAILYNARIGTWLWLICLLTSQSTVFSDVETFSWIEPVLCRGVFCSRKHHTCAVPKMSVEPGTSRFKVVHSTTCKRPLNSWKSMTWVAGVHPGFPERGSYTYKGVRVRLFGFYLMFS